MNTTLLDIKNLNTRLCVNETVISAVNDFDLTIEQGEIVAIVGESGSGKTISMLSISNLLPQSARISSGEITVAGKKVNPNDEKQLQAIRGSRIGYIFQDAAASLNPLLTIGEQIAEMFLFHKKKTKKEAGDLTLNALENVGLTPPQLIYRRYPHQLSGGMNQRAMIAMAIAAQPQLLIADEPTSSLDKITEIKILNLLAELNLRLKLSIILISHNISTVKAIAHRIAIMYCGKIVEIGTKDEIINSPKHPYTQALLSCIPSKALTRLPSIAGSVPNLAAVPSGCPFHPRCPFIMEKCKTDKPDSYKVSQTHHARCFLVQ